MLAAKAFARTSAYDAAIAGYMARQSAKARSPWRAFGGTMKQVLRYGENPHQTGSLWTSQDTRPGVARARQVQGKELSYNNINDTDAAFELVAEFDPARTAACAIIKHANPCGVAEGADLADAYRRALAGDPVSAFGGVVALNRTLDAETAAEIVEDLHRGHHRARRHRGGDRADRRQEEPAPAADRRPARPARRRPHRQDRRRGPADAEPRQCRRPTTSISGS